MDRDVVAVTRTGEFTLRLTFGDGTVGEVDFASVLSFKGVFAPLKDPSEFAKVAVNPEIGTICWPGGADIDPYVLYSRVTGAPLPGQN
ncbi:DUF2442 domain-containing protein [Magnetospirillum moscoviense]|uniref:Molybdopterin-guanine dinucleotide biosynthesis protein A n=1 Tax=Magnetospirillum moscoviense TaxID=1437059 RepID=A0A178MH95_9PROT|nr:DUF2442 domain-containing protein [Magnetospirillum moscoviense]MBF0325188.1 DUF2442 domain-containing protein [Alphaproteobacteria bacterium]OAN47913.1 molybdopterin-guanine dinucleotide biosynthesis protein A [Magnetospirillum moscoviense]